MKRIGRILLCLAAGLLVLAGASAAAEAKLSFQPESPRAGDYVDVTVVPEREGALGVRYELSTPDGVVCKNDKETAHFTASFRPREETVYTLTAVIVYGKKDTETVSVTIPVSGAAPAQEGPDVVYSQKDGWWHKTIYAKTRSRTESLEKGGCAIYSLSHVLQRLGLSGEEVQPAALAAANSRFYIEGRGTDNGGLIDRAAETYGFVTEEEVIRTEREAAYCLRRGDLFSFGIVLGHIAMVDGVSEDGTLVHVVDSAPGATFERKNRFKTKGHIYYQEEDGSFTEAQTADSLPGIRWFFETGEYGGAAYWMDLHYCLTYNKHAGMRLIRRPWLKMDGAAVTALEYAGTMMSRVKTGSGEAVRVPTAGLSWSTDGADSPQIAIVTNKKGANLTDGDGKTLARYTGKLYPGAMMMVLAVEDDLCYVFWKDTFCYIARKNIDLLPVAQGDFATGIVSMNGKTAGTAKVVVRNSPKAKGARITEWTIGTPVAIVKTEGDFTLVEGKGYRGWIQNKYLTRDAAD